MSTGFRPNEDGGQLIERLKRPGESTSELTRRGLRALAGEEDRRRAYEDMIRIAESGENLADEPDEWECTADGRVRVIGTDTTANVRGEETR
ncbi:hypothetical protein [Nocardiopsis dassonvillei]|uniref:hypothetical protein n=1 Tax=Nocardiopsis dassonvillei TaxID=2014 RepID=UPI00367363A9